MQSQKVRFTVLEGGSEEEWMKKGGSNLAFPGHKHGFRPVARPVGGRAQGRGRGGQGRRGERLFPSPLSLPALPPLSQISTTSRDMTFLP